MDPAAVSSFQTHLAASSRIVAIIGAGLSAPSGLSTFRSTNGLWNKHDVFLIASPAGWRRDPGLVWKFYSGRRRDALAAKPNPAHFALANLARHKQGFVALSQNVDGLLQRAGLNAGTQLKLLHGNLFDLACAGGCGYVEEGNTDDPLCPALSLSATTEEKEKKVLGADIAEEEKPPRASALLFAGIAAKNKKILGDEKFVPPELTRRDAAPLKELGEEERLPDTIPALHSGISKEELPLCPGCEGKNLLRPSVVWFGEALPEDVMSDVDALFAEEKIDLCLVIGTSSKVWPTAGFAEQARNRGARVAWVNTEMEAVKNKRRDDWVFLGDAGTVLPEILGVYGTDKLGE